MEEGKEKGKNGGPFLFFVFLCDMMDGYVLLLLAKAFTDGTNLRAWTDHLSLENSPCSVVGSLGYNPERGRAYLD